MEIRSKNTLIMRLLFCPLKYSSTPNQFEQVCVWCKCPIK